MTHKSSRSARPRRTKRAAQGRARNQLRIIGGKWRGRRIRFPAVEAIRPTPDRVRETLFNWLQQVIADSRCLDLFAGSGALGLEALSRGARQVVFVDRERAVIAHLRETLSMLGAQGAELRALDASRYLESPPEPFDIVFLDPPFANEIIPALCATLEDRGWLAPRAHVYIEQPAKAGPPALPGSWILLKSGRAGEVGYHLAQRAEGSPAGGGTR
jgi:16S rRNA (guanine966-N2)-methyltransferase